MTSPRVLLLFLAGTAAACRSTQPEAPPPTANVEGQVEEQLDQFRDEIRLEMQEAFTTREKSVHTSNLVSLLQTELRELEVEFGTLQRALEDIDPSGGEQSQEDLRNALEVVQTLATRFDDVERDLDSVVDDLSRLREELRDSFANLDAYRDAYRLALQVRREALREELDVINSALQEVEPEGVEPETTAE